MPFTTKGPVAIPPCHCTATAAQAAATPTGSRLALKERQALMRRQQQLQQQAGLDGLRRQVPSLAREPGLGSRSSSSSRSYHSSFAATAASSSGGQQQQRWARAESRKAPLGTPKGRQAARGPCLPPPQQRQRAKAAASKSSEQTGSSNYHAVVEDVGSFQVCHTYIEFAARNARWADTRVCKTRRQSQTGEKDVHWTRLSQSTFDARETKGGAMHGQHGCCLPV